MSDESRKHDHWAEKLEDEELRLLLQRRQAEALLKEHELALAQYRVDRLEREFTRRRGLEKMKERGAWRPRPALPWFPPKQMPSPPQSLPASSCSACGLRLETVMGIVCSRLNCPVGLSGPTC